MHQRLASTLRRGRLFGAALLFAALAACGGGASTEVNPVTTSSSAVDSYSGPAAANADVQAFRLNLWQNIKAENRCGGCHKAGGQSPQFARNDDVNLAYEAANTVVNLTQPDQSRMVQKVAGGHNCWLNSASACGDTLTVWIRNWAGASAVGGKQIELQEPPQKDVGSSKAFPDDSALYGSTIWPLVKQYCSRCHSPNAIAPQSPFFASSALDEAYAAAKAKINLDDPDNSRFVVRLAQESHNCWTTCGDPKTAGTAANAMSNAVYAFANGIPLTQVDPALVVSKALTLYDGTVAAGSNRYESSQIALYEFKTNAGTVAYDTSGVEPAAHLYFSDPDPDHVAWVGGWGINIRAGGFVKATTAGSRKFSDTLKSTGEFTIEAWIADADVAQKDAYVVGYSGGEMSRNFALGQHAYQYEALVRSDKTDGNGAPSLLTKDTDKDAQASLQHVVLTYDPVNGRRLYVNGVFTGDVDAQHGGSIANWDDSFAFTLGNDTSGKHQWQGVVRLVAVHSRALTQDQIQQNYAAGVGERYYMLFNVSALTNINKAYVMFEASLNDSYSYVFSKPKFISLDPAASIGSVPISGMRIGVNGKEARVGQAYSPMATTVSSTNYVAGAGQLLSPVGTVIGLEKGPDSDLFFLTFEQIGTNSHAVIEPAPPAPAPPADLPPSPDIGMRTFDRLNQAMSNITGVPTTDPGVMATYTTVKQQLPSVPDFTAFLASHQTGVAQLAIKYCAQLVADNTRRSAFFPGVDVNANASSFFGSTGSAGRLAVINPLLVKVVGSNLQSQPLSTDVSTEVDSLITRLVGGGASVSTVTKAACGAVLGSAALTVQ